ncbi:unnamed protein product [Boreogadus saida]
MRRLLVEQQQRPPRQALMFSLADSSSPSGVEGVSGLHSEGTRLHSPPVEYIMTWVEQHCPKHHPGWTPVPHDLNSRRQSFEW